MKKRIAIILAILIFAGALWILPVHGEDAVYDSVIRLHVLANSDSESDQALKLQVRDAVLSEMAPVLSEAEDRDEAIRILEEQLPAIRDIAERTLRASGSTDPVRVTLGEEHYPTRQYESLAFPAGTYLSLRIMIGEAAGQNWWCVLFPPLCLSAATARDDAENAFLSAGLTGDQYRIITDSGTTKYRLRFKILEMAQSFVGK